MGGLLMGENSCVRVRGVMLKLQGHFCHGVGNEMKEEESKKRRRRVPHSRRLYSLAL